MITLRFRLFPSLFIFSLLTACASTVKPEPESKPAGPETAQAEANLPKVALTPDILYNLLAALPAFDMGSLMTVLMGMLGLGGLRTFEKTKGLTR